LGLLFTASGFDSFDCIVFVLYVLVKGLDDLIELSLFKVPAVTFSPILTVLLFCKIVEFREVLAVAKGLASESVILTEALLAPNFDGSESLLMESLEVSALDNFYNSFCRAGSF